MPVIMIAVLLSVWLRGVVGDHRGYIVAEVRKRERSKRGEEGEGGMKAYI